MGQPIESAEATAVAAKQVDDTNVNALDLLKQGQNFQSKGDATATNDVMKHFPNIAVEHGVVACPGDGSYSKENHRVEKGNSGGASEVKPLQENSGGKGSSSDGTSAIEKALGKNQRLSDSVGGKKNNDLHEGDGSELNKRAGGEDGEPKELNNKNAQPLTDAQKSEVEKMIKELTSKHGSASNHVEKHSGSTTDAPMTTTPPIIYYPESDR